MDAVQLVNQAVIDGDEDDVLKALQNPILRLRDIKDMHSPKYLSLLQRHLETNEGDFLTCLPSSYSKSSGESKCSLNKIFKF